MPIQDPSEGIEDQEANVQQPARWKIFSGSSDEWTDDRIREYQTHIDQTRNAEFEQRTEEVIEKPVTKPTENG
jgi:hypothetical protein